MKIRSPIGESFAKLLEAFSNDKQNVHGDVLFQLFYDLYKVRDALYKYTKVVHRQKIWPTPDIFQDLLGKYLRIKLSRDYEVFLEYKEKHKKLQPDIMIQKNGKNWAIIEVKTTIGRDRGLVRDGKFKKRIGELSDAYGVPSKRVFYVLESCSNVGKGFEKMFSDDGNRDVKDAILPLFKGQVLGGLEEDCSEEKIKELYDEMVLVPGRFDEILKKVK